MFTSLILNKQKNHLCFKSNVKFDNKKILTRKSRIGNYGVQFINIAGIRIITSINNIMIAERKNKMIGRENTGRILSLWTSDKKYYPYELFHLKFFSLCILWICQWDMCDAHSPQQKHPNCWKKKLLDDL